MRAVGDEQVPEHRRKHGALGRSGVDSSSLRLHAVVGAASGSTTKIRIQPSDDVVMKGRRRNFGEEDVVMDAVKCLADIGGNNGSSHWGLSFVETPRHRGYDGKEGRRRRTERTEAVLIVRQHKRFIAVGKEKSFLYFDAGREERDRAIASSFTRRLPGFKDGKN